MKPHLLLPLFTLFLCSCNKQEEYTIPNYFKHGMKGSVESVFTYSYSVKDGSKEEYPKHYLFLYGDKFGMSCSRQQFDKDGNIIKLTTYADWATYSDSTVVTYHYQEGRLLSSTRTTYSRQYYAPSTSSFVYTDSGVLVEWEGKIFKINEDNQICEIDERGKTRSGYDIQHKEIYNYQGTMIKLYDMKTNALSILNTLDKDGNIIRHEAYSTTPSTSSKDTIVYSQFDELGNWTQRKKVDLSRGDTVIQCRRIQYYE